MKYILGAVLAAALAWSAYWVLGARAVERGLTAWLEARADAGWVVAWSEIGTGGFPYRFDTTLTELELADPATGMAWRAPEFQILALSYQPHHIIAFWPELQTIATPFETISATSQQMRGSIRFRPGITLEVTEAIFEFDSLGMSSTAEWRSVLADGLLAARQSDDDREVYDLAFTAREFLLPGHLRVRLRRGDTFETPIDILNLEARVTFDAPWDRYAIEERRPQPQHISLSDMRAEWGDLKLRVAGELEIDALGRASGKLVVKATNWREILELMRRSGAVTDGIATLIERGLNTLSRLSGNPKTLDIPFEVTNGRMSLAGLVPLGPAPNFRLR